MKNEDALFVQANGILKATRIGIAAAGKDCDTHESGLATVTYGTAHRDSWTLMLAKNAHRARYHQVNHTVISTGSGGLDGGNENTLRSPLRRRRSQSTLRSINHAQSRRPANQRMFTATAQIAAD